jgi:hypothetical protein
MDFMAFERRIKCRKRGEENLYGKIQEKEMHLFHREKNFVKN